MTWYKIVDDHNGILKTLYHGAQGSRILKTNEWLKADIKDVKDGSCKTTYKSGWHILPSREEAKAYLKKFKKLEKKKIVKCHANNIRPKAHSRSNVFLAEYILIEG